MRKFISKNKSGLILLALGILSFTFGIYREEHLTVLKKSIIICLECIGIGEGDMNDFYEKNKIQS